LFVIPEGTPRVVFAFAFLVVIPEGNLRSIPLPFVVIPEGNPRVVFAFAFLVVIPEGNLRSIPLPFVVIPEGNPRFQSAPLLLSFPKGICVSLQVPPTSLRLLFRDERGASSQQIQGALGGV